jgi:exonuclease SbcC
MIPVRLELHNFMPYRSPAPLDFAGIHVACLSGANGAGKSSLLDAITWALWGRARARREDELIHMGQSEMRVIFDFAVDSNTYQVIRKRVKTKRSSTGTLDFLVRDGDEWHTLNEPSMRATQAKIERVLRLDYDTFINSAFLLQGRADEFTIKTAAKRKEVLGNILGLGAWERYEDRAKETIKALDDQMIGLNAEIDSIKRELSEETDRREALSRAQQDLIAATEARATLEKEVQALTEAEIHLDNRREQRGDLERRTETGRRELKSIAEEAERLERELEAAQQVVARCDEIEKGHVEWVTARDQAEALTGEMSERLRGAITQLKEEAAALSTRNEALMAEMDDLRKSLDLIEGAEEPICPLCGQALDEGHRAQLADQFAGRGREKGDAWRANREQIEAIGERVGEHDAALVALSTTDPFAQLPALGATLKSLGYNPTAYQDLRARAVGLASFEARLAELQTAQENLPRLRESAANLAARRAHWGAELADDLRTLERQEREIAELEGQVAGAADLRARYRQRQDEERQAREAAVRASQLVDVLEQQRERLKELGKRQAHAQEERSIYADLRAAFGKGGVPAMIIEAAIPEIEDAANALLNKLTSGQMTLRFDTQREKVTGGVVETLDIKISDALGTRAYEMYSGGEAFRVNFAIRIALSRLLARRAGAQLRTLVIDEGFGTQDAPGRQRLVEAINAIQESFDKIIVITHIDELKDAFPACIEVTKTEQGAEISVV